LKVCIADKAGLDLNRRYGRFRTFVDGAPNGSLEPLQIQLVPVSGPQPDEIAIVLCGSNGLLVASRNTLFASEVTKLACQGRLRGEKPTPENHWAYAWSAADSRAVQ